MPGTHVLQPQLLLAHELPGCWGCRRQYEGGAVEKVLCHLDVLLAGHPDAVPPHGGILRLVDQRADELRVTGPEELLVDPDAEGERLVCLRKPAGAGQVRGGSNSGGGECVPWAGEGKVDGGQWSVTPPSALPCAFAWNVPSLVGWGERQQWRRPSAPSSPQHLPLPFLFLLTSILPFLPPATSHLSLPAFAAPSCPSLSFSHSARLLPLPLPWAPWHFLRVP